MTTPISLQNAQTSEQRIRERIQKMRLALMTPQAARAAEVFPECRQAVDRMSRRLTEFESKLESIPPIDVAVLGPSRHGKSTLLNAVTGIDLLPTSDVKPCTASILKMQWASEWSLSVRFVTKEQVLNDWREAVHVATEALSQQRAGEDEVSNDDPRFVKTVLQRFIQLFQIDPDLPPDALLSAVRTAEIPPKLAKLLGQNTRPKVNDRESMKATVEQYLSTTDVNWTIVEECQISGPFEDWHPSLSLVDLPGTNDTDPQRTAVTNSVKESATAVAIVTSDSNLGPDIESWLRHSSVLANFLEATSKRRQRLFIIRTKLDSYHPNIDERLLDGVSEEEESRIHTDAVDAYKAEQSRTFHSMLRDIAAPKLPHGDDDTSRRQRTELLSRIDDIQVFFVSALAHEVFCDRYSASRRTRRQLTDYFDEDVNATGIPKLRNFLTDVAKTYLSDNFYEDIETAIESEVHLLAGAFQKAASTTKAEIAGGQESLKRIVATVQTELIPWLHKEVKIRADDFRLKSLDGANGIKHRLGQVDAMSERRFEDKITIWTSLHWASLRAVARKNGTHVTARGRNIDLNEDVCSVLIDDVLLAWTHFRDHLISDQISRITIDLTKEINLRLQELQDGHGIPEVAEAIHYVSQQLMGITDQQRLELLEAVNDKISQVESIRKPAYGIAQEELSSVLSQIANESGTGCSYRMQTTLRANAPAAILRIRKRINTLVETAVSELSETCNGALTRFGQSATVQIGEAITYVSNSLSERGHEELEARVEVVDSALKLLPAPE